FHHFVIEVEIVLPVNQKTQPSTFHPHKRSAPKMADSLFSFDGCDPAGWADLPQQADDSPHLSGPTQRSPLLKRGLRLERFLPPPRIDRFPHPPHRRSACRTTTYPR